MMAAAAAASFVASSASATNMTATADPAVAPPTVAGYVGLYGGALFAFLPGGPFLDVVVPVATVDAAVVWSRSRMDVELELRGYGLFQPGILSYTGAVVHAYGRNASAALGGFVGYELDHPGSGGIPIHIVHVGVEAVLFRDRTSLYGQLATANFFTPLGIGFNWYARGAVRFFPRDNVRLELGMRFERGMHVNFETEGEVQLPGRPLSFLANVRADYTSGIDRYTYAVQAGFRLNFGGGNLIDQRAPMDTLPRQF